MKTDKEEEEKEPVDVVSAAIMAAVLEEREKERTKRHCPTCTCTSNNQTTNNFYSDDQSTHGSSPNDNDHSSHMTVFNKTGSKTSSITGQSSQYGLNVIDVGTQTVASYIGERGKVTSTCIYCHSNNRNLSSGLLESHDTPESSKGRKNKRPIVYKYNAGSNKDDLIITNSNKIISSDNHNSPSISFPWDWSLESQDSGSPSTPTSLTSASLSYESEASSFTSPQDSPGRISLTNTMPKTNIFTRSSQSPIKQESSNQMCYSTSNKSSINLSSGDQNLDNVSQISNQTVISNNINNYQDQKNELSLSQCHDIVAKVVQNSENFQYDKTPPINTVSLNSIASTKVPFNARSSHFDVFTPPIHRSPPLSSKKTESSVTQNWKNNNAIVVASSTSTASATETTL